jgi:hypothetical protein
MSSFLYTLPVSFTLSTVITCHTSTTRDTYAITIPKVLNRSVQFPTPLLIFRTDPSALNSHATVPSRLPLKHFRRPEELSRLYNFTVCRILYDRTELFQPKAETPSRLDWQTIKLVFQSHVLPPLLFQHDQYPGFNIETFNTLSPEIFPAFPHFVTSTYWGAHEKDSTNPGFRSD